MIIIDPITIKYLKKFFLFVVVNIFEEFFFSNLFVKINIILSVLSFPYNLTGNIFSLFPFSDITKAAPCPLFAHGV